MSFNTEEYIAIFIEESGEYIEQLDILLVELEKDKSSHDILKKIYRIMHTLKGISGIVGFQELSDLMHRAESLLDRLIGKNMELSSKLLGSLYRLVDVLKKLINQLRANGDTTVDFKEEAANLDQILDQELRHVPAVEEEKPAFEFKLERHADAILKGAEAGKRLYEIRCTIAKDEELKKARLRILSKKLGQCGEVLDVFPKRENDYYTTDALRIRVLFIGHVTDALLAEVGRVDRIEGFEYSQIEPVETAGAAQKADVQQQDDVFKREQEFTTLKEDDTIKVKVVKMDKLLNYAQELTIANQAFQMGFNQLKSLDGAREVLGSIEHTIDTMVKTTQVLHEELMRARMVPVGNLFRRFYRPTRDISAACGKKVNLKISGTDVEIDKNSVDLLFEPLLHLIRNAIDHGIEPPETRALLSKNEEGTLEVRSFNKDNRTIIEISDDGKGIDLEKVRSSGIKKGLVAEDAVLNRDAILDLIYLPNFSTKEEANELAGRGMGMNIVKEAIEKLSGEIAIDTEAGKGTAFSISLPMTLSVISALIVKSGGEVFAIPFAGVKEIITVEKHDIRTVYSKKVYSLRGRIVPLISLGEYMKLESTEADEEMNILVIGDEDAAFGIIVAEIVDKQDIVSKPITNTMIKVAGINGVSILGDGSVVLIIDVNDIAKEF